ncbi:MAG: hypothetical protein WC852_00295 [Candidatus Nanoarchaeia archaeon]|jgi:hypothetical protein
MTKIYGGKMDTTLEKLCQYHSCSGKAISIICANKTGEDPIYALACETHEPDIIRDMKDLYVPMGYLISILDIAEDIQ